MKTLLARALALLCFASVTELHAQVPQLINYQGRLSVGNGSFNGSGMFKFALVDTTGANTYWSNDGTSTAGSQPTAAVAVTVTKGLYSVLLGDTTLMNMTAVPIAVFANTDVRLRVWFNDGMQGFQQLSPDQRISAVGYAMIAGGFAGNLLGDVTGTQAATSVGKIQGRTVSAAPPADGQALRWDSNTTQWRPRADVGRNWSFPQASAPSLTFNNTSFVAVFNFVFDGTTDSLNKLSVICSAGLLPSSSQVRLVDITNNTVIALLDVAGTLQPSVSFTTSIANLPVGVAVFEIQVRRTLGPNFNLFSVRME